VNPTIHCIYKASTRRSHIRHAATIAIFGICLRHLSGKCMGGKDTSSSPDAQEDGAISFGTILHF
jgi:hypothetical protein